MKSKFGIGFNPFVNESHIQCKGLLLLHWITRASSGARTQLRPSQINTDTPGSVRAVTNQWGSPLYMFDYDVFGTPLQDRPERFRHGFTGKEFDGWTGLYNYGFRDYASLYGRFTTVDPIQDGLGWYAYVNSDPVNWLDPWGLKGQQSGDDPKNWYYVKDPDYSLYRNQQKLERKLDSLIKEYTQTGSGKYYSAGQCDGFIETLLLETGQNPDSYFAGKASAAFVQDHIDKNLNNGMTVRNEKSLAPNLPDGSYIVMMNDSYIISPKTNKPLDPHSGVLQIHDGSVVFTDNSSGNYENEETKTAEGGIESHTYDTVQGFQNDYGYNAFHYVRIRVQYSIGD